MQSVEGVGPGARGGRLTVAGLRRRYVPRSRERSLISRTGDLPVLQPGERQKREGCGMTAMPHEPLKQADVLLEGFLALAPWGVSG